MTDQKFYLAVGISSALFALNFIGVLAVAFWQSKRFEDMRDSLRAEISRVEGTLRSEFQLGQGILRTELQRVESTLRSEIQRVESTLRSEILRVEGVIGIKIDALSDRVKVLEDEIHSPLVKQ